MIDFPVTPLILFPLLPNPSLIRYRIDDDDDDLLYAYASLS